MGISILVVSAKRTRTWGQSHSVSHGVPMYLQAYAHTKLYCLMTEGERKLPKLIHSASLETVIRKEVIDK